MSSALDPAPAPTIWRPPLRSLTLGLTLVVVAGAFEALAVATILPTTLQELGGLAQYGWTFSAFQLTNVVGISLGGDSDRFGIARAFIAGVLLFCVGLAVSGFAPSMLVVVLGRSLQGLGSGLLYTASYAAIPRAYAVDLQPRMLATLSSAWVIPGLVGPALAGVVAEQLSWRWVFWGLMPMTLFAALLALPALRSLPPEPTPPDHTSPVSTALQLGAGACAALVGLGEPRWQVALPLAAGGGVIALRALRALFPPGTLVARKGQPAAVATMLLLTFAFFGTEAFVPLALTNIRHAPVLISGLALTFAALTWTAGAWLPVRLPRVGRRKLIGSGVGLLALGFAGVLLLLSPAVPVTCAWPAWAIAGLGMGLAFTTTSAAILESAGPSEASRASASLQLAQVLGAALSTGLGGVVVASELAGDPPVRGISAVIVMMIAACALALVSTRGIADTSPQP